MMYRTHHIHEPSAAISSAEYKPKLTYDHSKDQNTGQSDIRSIDDTAFCVPVDNIPPAQLNGGTSHPSQIVVSVPHAGRYYASELFSHHSMHAARGLEDKAADWLSSPLAGPSRPVLTAQCARAVCDLNRPENCLDPLLFDEDIDAPDGVYHRYIMAGYGVIPRLDSYRKPLHTSIDLAFAHHILHTHHRSYHTQLSSLLSDAAQHHQNVMLIDIHTMPDIPAHLRSSSKRDQLPDIVLGNLHGATLPVHLKDIVDKLLHNKGFSWGWNRPYSGGYITRHYGLNATFKTHDCRLSALQIECNRATILDNSGRPNEHAHMLSELLIEIADTLSDALSDKS